MSVTLRELGLDHSDGYHIMDLYDNYDYGIVTPERRFKVDVNPSGSKNHLLKISRKVHHYSYLGVVMIRCDIHKGKLRLGNFIEPGRDAQPRKDEGFVIDHGNIGFIRNAYGRHPFGGARVPQRRYADFYRSLDEDNLHKHGYSFQRIHTNKK